MGAKPQPACGIKDATALPPGSILEGRFVIQRLLGVGGMGEVYEAEDLRLNRARIALKTIRSDHAANLDVRERFQREVLLARSIAHPNVCPVYEFFATDSPAGEIWFLTMKLLHGETLAARLKAQGRLPMEEAIVIARQVSAALEAAHCADIVHRDLTPGNIFLERHAAGVRAVITDFGLAKLWVTAPLTGHSAVVGTPGYMAPEILLGDSATPRSDVYSLGIVLETMLFGRSRRGAAAVDAVTQPLPKDPSSRRALEVIRRCTEASPALRFPSAAAAIEALERGPGSDTILLSRRKALVSAGAGLAAVALAGWLSKDQIAALLHPVPKPRRVALLTGSLQGASTEDASLLGGVLDAVGNALARAETEERDLFVVPPRYLRQQGVTQASDAVGLFGVNLLLRASLGRVADTIRIGLQLLRPSHSAAIRQTAIACPPASLHLLPSLVGQAAASLLDISRTGLRWDEPGAMTTNPEASAAYERARHLLYIRGLPNIEKAITELQKALDLDARFAEAWAALGQAYAVQYGVTRNAEALSLAERNVNRALELVPGLTAGYSSRAAIAVHRGEYERAVHDLELAARSDPENKDVQLTLAHTYAVWGKLDLADRAYQQILGKWPNDWTPLNDWGLLYFQRAHYVRAGQLFREATVAAPQAALPWRNLGAAYLMADQLEDAQNAFDRSIALLPSGEAYSNRGTALLWLGRYRESAQAYRAAVDLNPGRYELWGNCGDAYQLQGMAAEARNAWQRAAALAQSALVVNPKNRGALASLALYQAKLGQREAALQSLQRLDNAGPLDVSQLFLETLAYELIHQREVALKLLSQCMDRGYSLNDVQHAPELQALRKDIAFKRLLAAQNGQPIK